MSDFIPLGSAGSPKVLHGFVKIKNEIAIWRHSYRYCLQLIARRGIRRTSTVVHKDYSNPSSPYDWNMLSAPCMARINGKLAVISSLAMREQAIDVLAQVVLQSNPSNILEVGCGEGINIALFALRHPEMAHRITFSGFDLVQQRVIRARELMQHLGLPNVKLWQGDATKKQVSEQSVQLAYSVHAIEQMQEGWRDAITQMRDAASKVLLIEPFYERKAVAGKLHSRAHGYFRGTIQEVVNIGFRLEKEFQITMQDPFNRSTAILLARR